jgi:hypothetical protein
VSRDINRILRSCTSTQGRFASSRLHLFSCLAPHAWYTGSGWASVLNTHWSNGSTDGSSPNRRYRYFSVSPIVATHTHAHTHTHTHTHTYTYTHKERERVNLGSRNRSKTDLFAWNGMETVQCGTKAYRGRTSPFCRASGVALSRLRRIRQTVAHITLELRRGRTSYAVSDAEE